MKFEKITDSKIKIVFSLEDMNINNISAKTFLSNNTVSQKVLQDILKEAEKEIGFQTDDSKLLVEALLATDGGLIFTITKLSNSLKNKDLSYMFFEFESFDNLLSFCTYIDNVDNFNNLSVILYNNKYYLDISFYDDTLHDYFYNILTEFANPITYSPTFKGILNEYGKVILDKNNLTSFIKLYI